MGSILDAGKVDYARAARQREGQERGKAAAVSDMVDGRDPHDVRKPSAISVLANENVDVAMGELGIRVNILPDAGYSPEFQEQVEGMEPLPRSQYELNRVKVLNEVNRAVTPMLISQILTEVIKRYVPEAIRSDAREYVRGRLTMSRRKAG